MSYLLQNTRLNILPERFKLYKLILFFYNIMTRYLYSSQTFRFFDIFQIIYAYKGFRSFYFLFLRTKLIQYYKIYK